MCKLVAFLNKEDYSKIPTIMENKLAKMFQHILYNNSFGQTDGTGIMAMDSDGNIVQHKRAIPSPDFINTKAYDDLFSDVAEYSFVAGHTRYSTVGSNSDQNSHPFEHGNYVLMQNGTIDSRGVGHKQLVPGFTSPCQVDSESVCWSMSQQGVEKTFERYKGAGVFMYLNKSDYSFNVVKNDERTLFFCKVKDLDIFFLATEEHSIRLAASRAGVLLEKDEVSPVVNGQLLSWDIFGNFWSKPLTINKHTFVNSWIGGSKNKNNNLGKSQKSHTTPQTSKTPTPNLKVMSGGPNTSQK